MRNPEASFGVLHYGAENGIAGSNEPPVRTVLPFGANRAYRMNFCSCNRITGVKFDAFWAARTSSAHPCSHGHQVISSSPQFGHAWIPLGG